MLNVNDYIKSPPSWATSSTTTAYEEACAKLGIQMGQNPSRLCPCGGHEGSSDKNLRMYPNGLYCFSQHGRIPPERVIKFAGLPNDEAEASLSKLALGEVRRFVARDQLKDMLSYEIAKRLSWDERRVRAGEQALFEWAVDELSPDADDTDPDEWSDEERQRQEQKLYWHERFLVIFHRGIPKPCVRVLDG